jgi:hypothetical protein
MKYCITGLFLFFGIAAIISAQGTDIRGTQKQGFYFGFSIIPSQAQITNTMPSDFPVTASNKISVLSGIEVGYSAKYFGFSAGFGYSSYSSKLSMSSYESTFESMDSENDPFQMHVKGNAIVEEQKISFLDIPICLNFQYPLGEKFGIYAQAGLQFSLPMGKTYTEKGMFTYEGTYPQYNITLSDLPDYGFPKDYSTEVSDKLDLKSMNMSMVASGGMSYKMNSNMQLIFGFNFIKSISNLSAYSADASTPLSEYQDNLKSLMNYSTKTGIQAIGFKLGIKYFMR